MLAKLNRVANQPATIASVDDAKDIRDKAEAIRVYSRQQKHCQHIEREATVIRLRAERQLGKLLPSSDKCGNPRVMKPTLRLLSAIRLVCFPLLASCVTLVGHSLKSPVTCPGGDCSLAVVRRGRQVDPQVGLGAALLQGVLQPR